MSSQELRVVEGQLADMNGGIDMPQGMSRPEAQREVAGVAARVVAINGGNASLPLADRDVVRQGAVAGLGSAGRAVASAGISGSFTPTEQKSKQQEEERPKSFIRGMSDSMGITDIFGGLYDFGRNGIECIGAQACAWIGLFAGIGQALVGRKAWSEVGGEFVNHMTEALHRFGGMFVGLGRALKGLAIFASEVLGLTDLYMAVRCALRGEWGQAGMHLAFAALSAGAIVATVMTVGAASGAVVAVASGRAAFKTAAKEVLHTASKEFFKGTGKEIGEAILKKAGPALGPDVLQKAAVEAAEKTEQNLAKLGAANITQEATERAAREAMDEVSQKILREAGVDKLVDKSCYELLQGIESKSVKELAKELEEKGIKNAVDAKNLAKELKAMLNSGKSDEMIKQALEDGMSEPIIKHLQEGMEKAFKDRLRKGVMGEAGTEASEIVGKALRAQAEKAGKSLDDLADEYVEAGWKGAREGIESGTRKVVREGIEKAFRRFRDVDMPAADDARREQDKKKDDAPLIRVTSEEMRKLGQEAVEGKKANIADLADIPREHLVETRHLRVNGRDVDELWEFKNGLWEKVSEKMLDEVAEAAKRAA